jgi:hypothetical protein
MATNSYSNGNDFQTLYGLGTSDQGSQYFPTPGYFGCTPASRYSLSASPGHYTQNDLGDLPQHHAENHRLLQLSEWDDGISNDELPASYIRYMRVEGHSEQTSHIAGHGTGRSPESKCLLAGDS